MAKKKVKPQGRAKPVVSKGKPIKKKVTPETVLQNLAELRDYVNKEMGEMCYQADLKHLASQLTSKHEALKKAIESELYDVQRSARSPLKTLICAENKINERIHSLNGELAKERQTVLDDVRQLLVEYDKKWSIRVSELEKQMSEIPKMGEIKSDGKSLNFKISLD